jgi:benzylsuccinate CoA-transferase BbsF subunit
MGTIDLRVGSTGAFAVLAALYHHQRTGKGQHIDLSSAEAVSALMGDAFMDYTMNGRVQERMGNRDQVMAPHGCYRCRGEEEWVTIAVSSEEEWRSLCRVLAYRRLTEDERFADGYSRWQNQDDLDKIIGEWTAGRSAQEVMQSLQSAGVAAMPVYDGPSLVRDAQVEARGFLTEVEHPAMGKKKVIGSMWGLSKTPAAVKRHGPLLGQDNDYVLGRLLGMSPEERARLVEEQVIY